MSGQAFLEDANKVLLTDKMTLGLGLVPRTKQHLEGRAAARPLCPSLPPATPPISHKRKEKKREEKKRKEKTRKEKKRTEKKRLRFSAIIRGAS